MTQVDAIQYYEGSMDEAHEIAYEIGKPIESSLIW